MKNLLRQFLSFVLPITVLILVPALIERNELRPGGWLYAGLALIAAGLAIMATTIGMLIETGQGTLAPWDPPRNLVLHGPYTRVRNPMILGVLITLAGEALAWRSWRISAWMVFFFFGNTIYFRFIEEPSLERRFGAAYVEYKRNVPRWLPRLKAWHPETTRDGRPHGLRPD